MLCLLIVAAILNVYYKIKKHVYTIYLRRRLLQILIFTIGCVIWPFLWKRILGEFYVKYQSWPGLLWPILILLSHIYFLRYANDDKSIWKRMPVDVDASSICSLTFTLSSILSSNTKKCSHIFIAAVLGCLLFIIPVPSAPKECMESMVLESIQHVCLSFSTGLLLSGVLIATDCNAIFGV